MPAANPERRLRVWAAIERYASDPKSGRVTLDQLCQETGASKRMLHDVCRAFSGLSVKAHIQRQRMQLARDMLVRAKPEQTTVTRVATFCGFYQLGRHGSRHPWPFEGTRKPSRPSDQRSPL